VYKQLVGNPVHALQVELPTVSMTVSNPELSIGKECQKIDLDTTAGEDASSLDL
jgi:hypothetical protein